MAAKLAIQTYTKNKPVKAIHIRMDNIVAITYLLKMGSTKNQEMTIISKEIWNYLMSREITITAEYLPGKLNIEADRESRQVNDSSKWKLCITVFQKIVAMWGSPKIDLLASRISHQVKNYFSWKIDPYCLGRDAP